jgi:molybdopterin/thiamine biosynthesis adenylyltransferase
MTPPTTLTAPNKLIASETFGDRYIRQELYRPIGREGQEKLKQTQVALIGCGALGSAIADMLVRAGIGTLTIVDRDYVELHNLQRQSLFTEADVTAHTPKAVAAAQTLATINSDVRVIPVVADFNGSNAERLARNASVIVDGTDNFETRYLLNDLAVKSNKPWVYGGVIASYGTTMTIRPGITQCLRCIFPDQPEPGSAPTCDTAGVIGPAVHAIAAIEAAEVMKLALEDFEALNSGLLTIDIWQLKFDQVALDFPRPDCPACSSMRFDFLDRARPSQSTVLCGHDAIQVLPEPGVRLDLQALAERLRPVGEVMVSRFLLRFDDASDGRQLTVFPDGRAIIKGTTDETEARSLYARFVGA